MLEVPSPVMPIEHNPLFDPAHEDFKRVRVVGARGFNPDVGPVGLGS